MTVRCCITSSLPQTVSLGDMLRMKTVRLTLYRYAGRLLSEQALMEAGESGLYNALLWDGPLAAITDSSDWARGMQVRYDALSAQGERPKPTYIERYSYLIENLYDPDDGINYDYDLARQKHIKRDTGFSYMPFYAEIPGKDTGAIVMNTLRTHCFCTMDQDCLCVPRYDMCQVDFDGEFYWRGPVWINVNWYISQGVRDYGETEPADWIENSLIALADRQGSYEYYDPSTGRGLGAKDFSWTAALIIDLVSRRLSR